MDPAAPALLDDAQLVLLLPLAWREEGAATSVAVTVQHDVATSLARLMSACASAAAAAAAAAGGESSADASAAADAIDVVRLTGAQFGAVRLGEHAVRLLCEYSVAGAESGANVAVTRSALRALAEIVCRGSLPFLNLLSSAEPTYAYAARDAADAAALLAEPTPVVATLAAARYLAGIDLSELWSLAVQAAIAATAARASCGIADWLTGLVAGAPGTPLPPWLARDITLQENYVGVAGDESGAGASVVTPADVSARLLLLNVAAVGASVELEAALGSAASAPSPQGDEPLAVARRVVAAVARIAAAAAAHHMGVASGDTETLEAATLAASSGDGIDRFVARAVAALAAAAASPEASLQGGGTRKRARSAAAAAGRSRSGSARGRGAAKSGDTDGAAPVAAQRTLTTERDKELLEVLLQCVCYRMSGGALPFEGERMTAAIAELRARVTATGGIDGWQEACKSAKRCANGKERALVSLTGGAHGGDRRSDAHKAKAAAKLAYLHAVAAACAPPIVPAEALHDVFHAEVARVHAASQRYYIEKTKATAGVVSAPASAPASTKAAQRRAAAAAAAAAGTAAPAAAGSYYEEPQPPYYEAAAPQGYYDAYGAEDPVYPAAARPSMGAAAGEDPLAAYLGHDGAAASAAGHYFAGADPSAWDPREYYGAHGSGLAAI